MRNLLAIQVFVVCLVTGFSLLMLGRAAAAAAAFGGGVALSNTLLLAWRSHQAERRVGADVQGHLRAFYFSAFERFVIVGMLLGAGLGALNLLPLPLLSGFIAGQLTLMIFSIRTGLTTHVE
ncbi:ATP synthase subunit I [Thiohalobacter sp. IOR34]|uniref:ATP synthase subunit I n=1 Tax=Thiohalobacter sp. IOR34 TaxID=3057176 RepID=UPI0025B0B224|nr:ATP synthase subunit I [Thiohalobacter sp. IOR34]WJW75497.1 ATP synthase subunit I [Thiohalobacter sp. IOR34]